MMQKFYKTLTNALRNLKIPNRFYYGLVLLIITFIAFSPALNNSFTNWDDPIYVINNELIKSLTWQNISHIFSPTTFSCGNYHPVTILSLAINYNIGQLDPFGYILMNLILHLLSVLLVFTFIKNLFKNDLVAFIVAFLFGIHPMNVEPVAWVAGRKDVLFVFFYLASLVVYLKYLEKENKRQILSYLGVFILFMASLLSKGTAVTLLAVLFLIDYYKGRKLTPKLILEKIPFIVLAAAIVSIEMKSQEAYGAVAPDASFGIMLKRFIVCYGYDCLHYIVRFFAPINLSACYPNLITMPDTLPFIYYAGFIGVIALALLDLYFIKRNKIIFFGLTFFFIALSTGLHFRLVSAAMVADRYTYIPYIGLSLIVAWYFEKVLSGIYLKGFKRIFIIVGILVVIILSVSTYARCDVWRNSGVLFTDVISKHPDIPVAYVNRGSYYFKNEFYKGAITDYSKAIELDSIYTLAYYNRGVAYSSIEALDLAIQDFSKAIQLNPGYADAYNNRGIVFMVQGNPEEAIKDYSQSLIINPKNTCVNYNRGLVYKDMGLWTEAIKDFSAVITQNPDYIGAYINRGMAYLAAKNPDLAILDFNKVIMVYPNEAEIYRFRAQCFELKGILKEAESDYRKYDELMRSQ